MNGWLRFSANRAICRQYHGGINLLFLMKWWLYLFCSISTSRIGIYIVLTHVSNNLQVNKSLYSDILPWFRTNQSFLLQCTCTTYYCLHLTKKEEHFSFSFDVNENWIHDLPYYLYFEIWNVFFPTCLSPYIATC